MKIFVVLAAVFAVGFARSATVLNSTEVTDELIKNPRYLVVEREDGLFEVEDLEDKNINPALFADENDVSFFIYTPENTNGIQIRASQVRDITLFTRFDPSRNTVVIIHGWRNHFESSVNTEIISALLEDRHVNVIVADWSGIADRNYLSAQGSVLAVGNFIGDFLISLNTEVGYSLARVTLVGHSLGAHIAGNAGARTQGLVDTIVGLDPAGPLFFEWRTDNRLDPTDANYVHVIHTNDGLLGFGIKMGHVDYYPNGGAAQPGCIIDLAGTCSHSRAYIYYAESIRNNNFVSRICSDYDTFQNNLCNNNVASFLGSWPVVRSQIGDYFLLTNNRAPFARG